LTPIEQHVLRCVASALSPDRIAQKLGLQREEVTRVKDEAMRKAGLTTRIQIMDYLRERVRRDGVDGT
jgi:DNA-binding NarL/FixJ family response regulator